MIEREQRVGIAALAGINYLSKLIAKRERILADPLSTHERKVDSGKKLIDLIAKRRRLWDELEGILDRHFTEALRDEFYEISGL